MRVFARSEANGLGNPKIQLFVFQGDLKGGELVVPDAVTFRVLDISSSDKVIAPVVVVTGAIDLDTSSVRDGQYAPTFAIPSGESVGRHAVEFTTTFEDASSRVETFEFEVVAGPTTNDELYVVPSDFIIEGFTTLDPNYALMRCMLATKFVDATTKRFFCPRWLSLRLNGRGGTKLLFDDPIILLDTVKFDVTPWAPSATQLARDLFRTYNRHLTEGLLSPDDRNNPKVEIFNPIDRYFGGSYEANSGRVLSRINFPVGQKNVWVEGLFGYTDPDGTGGVGQTPMMLRHVAKLLAVREIDKMSSTAARFDRHARHRLTSERTRDQAYTLEPLGTRNGAFFTGDPEIDNILAYFQRPPALGSA